MSFTLKNMLKMPNFKKFMVLAGENGLNRLVTSVTVMDAPDISDWLKGGEILMTTGFIMREDALKFKDLIERIDRANAAALFIKMNRFISELPQEVYDIAEKLNFPLVSMPLNCAFTDVINPVLSVLVNEQSRRLKMSENIHRSFTNLVLNGGDVDQIIGTLSKITGGSAAYLDTKFRQDCISSHSEEFNKQIIIRDIGDIMAKYKSYPIRIGKKNYGYIVYEDNKNIMENFSDIAVEHAGTVLKLSIQRHISNIEIENRHRTEFVQDLILKNFKTESEIANKASLYGWNCERGIYAAVVEIDKFEQIKDQKAAQNELSSLETVKERIFDACDAQVRQSYPMIISAVINDSLIFLIEPEISDFKDFSAQLAKNARGIGEMILRRFGYTITIGVGDYRETALEACESYQEAKSAVKIGKRLNVNDKILFYRQLGIYRLLGSFYNSPEAREFCDLSIGKLKQHDARYGTELFKTLICINDAGWNLKNASGKMFVHYNTMKYRYKKIEEILNTSLENSEERFNISMAIKLMVMNR